MKIPEKTNDANVRKRQSSLQLLFPLISSSTTTFQELFTIVQDDAITYEDCVREYYQPIIEEIGFFGN